jgi:hypothetical protein
MLKRLFFLSVMIGMVGMPYLMSSSSQWWNSLTSQFSGGSADGKAAAASAGAKQPGSSSTAKGDRNGAKGFDTVANSRTIEGPAAQNLAEVIQFDGSPAWVMARWPRVTAGLADLDLQGYRVPLVSGTSQDDLAGSLTYYFDKNQRMSRIIFHGATGDPRKLIALVTSRYNFEPQKTDDPSLALFQAKWNGKPHSELRIRPARVVRADQPYARFEVDLAMKRP